MEVLCETNISGESGNDGSQVPENSVKRGGLTAKYFSVTVLMIAVWWGVYLNLAKISQQLTHGLSKLLAFSPMSHFGSAVEFFIFEVPKVLMLLALVVFVVGIIRSFFTPERTRKILAGKRESVGNVLAALLGIVTPFCSCSAAYIPHPKQRFCDYFFSSFMER